MESAAVLSLLATVAGIGLAITVLVGGVLLLIRPLRAMKGAAIAASGIIHPAGIAGAFIVTVYFVPGPLDWTVSLFLQLVRFFASDAPKAILEMMTRTADQPCWVAEQAATCSAIALRGISRTWERALEELLSRFGPIPDLGGALVLFAILLAIAWAIQNKIAQGVALQTDSAWHKGIVLGLLLGSALYLCITAIIAIPVFNDRTDNLEEVKKQLTDQLAPSSRPYKDEVAKAILQPGDIRTPLLEPGAFERLRKDLQEARSQTAAPVPAAVPVSIGLEGPVKPVGSFAVEQARISQMMLPILIDQLQQDVRSWENNAKELERAATNFPGRAEAFAAQVVAHFILHNTARIGGTLTAQHAAVLASWYGFWLSHYSASLELCRSRLLAGLNQLDATYSELSRQIAQPSAMGPVPPPLTQGRASAVSEPCTSQLPNESQYLSSRRGPAESLGFFGQAAGWLLMTESRDLALITGLLGFGFFGALAASFIREFAGTSGNALPPSDWILPALIRGVGAAILVFLVTVGGIAIFTQAGPEPNPNPYAVFFACFIAAVFSEDVWRWARRAQEQRLGGQTGDGGKSGSGKGEAGKGEAGADKSRGSQG